MLIDIIDSLTKEEVRNAKIYLKRTNADKDRKDVWLFDQIRKSGQADEDALSYKLYKDNKNAYYRLKNRLINDINKSLLSQYYTSGETNQCFQLLLLSRLFAARSNYKLTHKYLRKAEQIAERSDQYEMLDIIYNDYIKLSHETLELNPEIYIEKRKDLADKMRQVREIDEVLAVLIYRVKKSQNYASRNEEVLLILKQTIDDYANNPGVKNSPVLRFKIYHALSRILLQQQDFISLESYLEDTFLTFEQEGLFDKSNHDTKLQMLTYWANSLFKNNKHYKSLEVAEKLHDEMQQFETHLKNKYLFFYINALIINYSILNTGKALEICESALHEPALQKNALNRIFLLLNKAQLLFDKKHYKEANRSILQLKLDDAFDKLDNAFRMKINIAEIIFRYEMRDYDTVEILVKNVRKEFTALLKEDHYERQKLLLELVLDLIITHRPGTDDDIILKIRYILNMIEDIEANESDLINYNLWLRPKIKTPLQGKT